MTGFNLNMPIAAIAAGAGSNQLKLPDFVSPHVGDPLALFDRELGFVASPAPVTLRNVIDNRDGTDTVTLSAGVPTRLAADLAGPSGRYIPRNNRYLHNRARSTTANGVRADRAQHVRGPDNEGGLPRIEHVLGRRRRRAEPVAAQQRHRGLGVGAGSRPLW
jgi:hypothetical protein